MRIGVLGGGNLLKSLGLSYREEIVETEFGPPSDALRIGTVGSIEVVTLLRHGRGHRTPAHRVNFRANISAMAQAAVDLLFGVSVCGDLSGTLPEGTIVLYQQILDFTHGRASTFFDEPPVRHVSVTNPVCTGTARWASAILEGAGVKPVFGGTMAVIEGPRFATMAETRMIRSLGGDYINMSAAPEAFLARERGLCYVPLSLITDGDNAGPESVTLSGVTAAIERQRDRMPTALRLLIDAIAKEGSPYCSNCRAPTPINASQLDL